MQATMESGRSLGANFRWPPPSAANEEEKAEAKEESTCEQDVVSCKWTSQRGWSRVRSKKQQGNKQDKSIAREPLNIRANAMVAPLIDQPSISASTSTLAGATTASNSNSKNKRPEVDGDGKMPYQALFDSIPQTGLKCDILFLVIKNRIQEEPEYVKRLRVVFQFNITKGGELVATWTCDTKTSIEGDIYRAPPKPGHKADCVLTVDDDDWVRIMVGKLNPQRAFMMSKFKIKGNIMLLQKLHAVWFELRRKGKTPELDLIQEIMVEEPLLPGLKSEAMAIEIVQRIVKMPHLVEKINASIQVDVLKDGKLMTQYLIGMYPGKKPEFSRLFNGLLANSDNSKQQVAVPASVSKADAVFTLEDDDLVLIIYGIYKVNQAIEMGKLKVEGRHDLVERARSLFEQPPIMAKL